MLGEGYVCFRCCRSIVVVQAWRTKVAMHRSTLETKLIFSSLRNLAVTTCRYIIRCNDRIHRSNSPIALSAWQTSGIPSPGRLGVVNLSKTDVHPKERCWLVQSSAELPERQ